MKFGVVNKSTTVNRFVLNTLQRNITNLAVITRKTNIKLGILKGGGETAWVISSKIVEIFVLNLKKLESIKYLQNVNREH